MRPGTVLAVLRAIAGGRPRGAFSRRGGAGMRAMMGGIRSGCGRPAASANRVPLALRVVLSGAVLALAGAAWAETWRGLTVAPEHR